MHYLDNSASLISNLISTVVYWSFVFLPPTSLLSLKSRKKREVSSEAADFLDTGLICFLAVTFSPVQFACFKDAN